MALASGPGIPGRQRSMLATEERRLVNAAIGVFERELSVFIGQRLVSALGADHAQRFAPRGPAHGPWGAAEISAHMVKEWHAVYQMSRLAKVGLTSHTAERIGRTVKKFAATGSPSTAKAMLRLMLSFLEALDSPAVPDFQTLLNTVDAASQPGTKDHASIVDESAMDVDIDPPAPIPSTNNPAPDLKTPCAASSALVVVDGSNVAWKHGGGQRYSRRGIVAVVHHFRRMGCRVLTFIPESRMRPTGNMDEDEERCLRTLRDTQDQWQSLVEIPTGDYDDAYLLAYARENAGIVVSNDRFRDHLAQTDCDGPQHTRLLQQYLDQCRVSFTFVGDEFMPDPTVRMDEAFSQARSLAILAAEAKSRHMG